MLDPALVVLVADLFAHDLLHFDDFSGPHGRLPNLFLFLAQTVERLLVAPFLEVFNLRCHVVPVEQLRARLVDLGSHNYEQSVRNNKI